MEYQGGRGAKGGKGSNIKGLKAGADKNNKGNQPSRKEYLDSKLKEDPWNKANWDRLSNADKREARKVYTFENENERNFWDKVRFGAKGTKFYEEGRTKRIKNKD